MRGTDQQQGHVFSYLSPEQRVRKDHPLRPIRTMVDQVLKELSPEFNKMYSKVGRPSIPPEQLLRALLLQMLYSVRSERLLVEEIDYNILFRWFVGLNLDDEVWDATVFTKNRDRLLEAEVAKEFLTLVVEQAREQGWASDEHFTVDGSLLEAWASVKSFQPKNKKSPRPPDDPGNPTVNYRGEKRSNETHESNSDPEAQMARKGPGKEAKLSYSGNLLVENRNGLIVDSRVWEATGAAERYAALEMLQDLPGSGRVTVGGDKGFDTADFVRECRNIWVTPHVAQNTGRRGGSAIDRRTARHASYALSQKKRKRIEECFGWLKTVALLRKVRHRGTLKVDWIFALACAAYNLVRMRNLMRSIVPT
jgi:transposase